MYVAGGVSKFQLHADKIARENPFPQDLFEAGILPGKLRQSDPERRFVFKRSRTHADDSSRPPFRLRNAAANEDGRRRGPRVQKNMRGPCCKFLRPLAAEREHVKIGPVRRKRNARFPADDRTGPVIADRPRGKHLTLAPIRQRVCADSHDGSVFIQQSTDLNAAKNLAVRLL